VTTAAGGPRGQVSALVSVIVPAFNAEAFIVAALESVARQTYPRLEIIVVDDGSTDRTADLVRAFARRDPRVRLIQQPNAGVAAARNAAISASRGDFIAPIDADDLWKPQKIERQMTRFLASDDRLGLVYCWWSHVDRDGHVALRTDHRGRLKPLAAPRGKVLHDLIARNVVGNGSTPLMRKRCVVEAGGYDPGLRARDAQGCEDWKLYLAIAERYDFDVVPEFLVGYRQTPEMMSRNYRAMQRSCELVLGEVRCRHPEIDASVFRRNAAVLTLWLMARDTSAISLLLTAVRRDPSSLLRTPVRNQLLWLLLRRAYRAAGRVWPWLVRVRESRRPFIRQPFLEPMADDPAGDASRHQLVPSSGGGGLETGRIGSDAEVVLRRRISAQYSDIRP
jgi:glycosyltransferase involved in cell wall biosynthesis